ncbi:hypothetical protein GpartN1_g3954.t1 [Galdieria partita]|uniref:Uncharacterized protein n=1 Tax=Galdieria partita TaxID=83374 RepID=A0A9C7PWL2_9RHOD|nr:hypothetical protein GpartN1_g3954.t1 [Galdieria partita]
MSTCLCRDCYSRLGLCFSTVTCLTVPTMKVFCSRLSTVFSRAGPSSYRNKRVSSSSHVKEFFLVCGTSRDNIERFRENLEHSFGELKRSYDKNFDGIQLRELLLQRYGLSYDIRLKVTPWFSGKYLLTANIMWLYVEQQSFPLTEHEYLCHLEAIAQYLNNWGVVDQFVDFLKSTKQKPRVAKAVSVPLDVSQEEIVEFMNGNK